MLESDDKRSYRRLDMECAASYRVDGSDVQGEVLVKDLSAGGVLLWSDREFPPDTLLLLTVSPVNPVTPPLTAQVRVVRCGPCEDPAYASVLACEMVGVVA